MGDAAAVLERALAGFRGQLTVADAAARSGLPTHEAGQALTLLAATHSGQLAATEKGELIYQFPQGLVRTDRPGLARRVGRTLAKVALGAVRFVVRAWVSVVLVGYALVFLGIALAFLLKSDKDNDGIGSLAGTVFQLVAEAVFWTFHPLSPAYLAAEPGWFRRRRRAASGLPFYERVNRFVFGPSPPPEDPRATTKKLLGEIRQQQGRVAPADVMRLTGETREEAERTLLRLVGEQQGDISVSETGAILYEFPQLRSTARAADGGRVMSAAPAWTEPKALAPLTGNGVGTNVLIGAVNGFNLVMGSVGLAAGLTLERLYEMAIRIGVPDAPPLPPVDGVPMVLGAIPLTFSAVLFALPALRAWRRSAAAAEVAHDNHRRAILQQLFGGRAGGQRFTFTPDELRAACAALAGRQPEQREVERAVQALGGTVELGPDGTIVYSFETLAREQAAVVARRRLAASDEASPGQIVFSSGDDLSTADS